MKLSFGLLTIGLALVELSSGQNLTAADLTNLERFWSYNRSAPIYPTPNSVGHGEWASAYAKAKALVAQMTDDEKNNITYGHPSTTGCAGVSGSVPRLGFPGLCLADGPSGVRAADGVNGWPSGIHVGASWNRQLTYERAYHIGAEFKNKGVSVALGPSVGALGKLAKGGRNWESFSNDPYLLGQLAYETVTGLEKHVMSCVKHLLANEQETNRKRPRFIEGALNQSLSTNIDPKTTHELYMWPFQDAVRAGAASVMCSFNRFNNSYACQNSYLQNGLLKRDLGFQGFIMTDWRAQQAGVASANSGLDMAMPNSPYWQDGNLTEAKSNGSLSQGRLDDMAIRILSTWYRLEELDSPAFKDPGFGLPANLSAPHTLVDARDSASKPINVQSAIEGHVLVKNVRKTLPLKKPKFLSLFGYDGVAPTHNTFDGGQKWRLGMPNALTYINGTVWTDYFLYSTFQSSQPAGTTGPSIALNGTVITGGGSGATTPAYIDSPLEAFQRRAYEDDTLLQWDFAETNMTARINPASDHCVVFINTLASEGWDRPELEDEYSNNLVNNVASGCNSTIVVIHSAGIRIVDAFQDHPNVTAIILGHLPGQESGRALLELMYGEQSPSGRLPYTIAKKESDYGILLNPTLPVGVDYYTQDNFTEGVYIDYKHFIAQNITPRYEFGYGLTYSTFNYSGIQITMKSNADLSYHAPNSTIVEGGMTSLWETVAIVSCQVTNSGDFTAAEVPQLYVGIPGGPQKVLRGFGKETLSPGASHRFFFELTRRDLSAWTDDGWVLQKGSYPIYIGKSVLNIQLTGTLTI